MIAYIRTLIQDAEAFLAAHPQLITTALTAAATLLARFGFDVSATTLAVIASAVVTIISALIGTSVHRVAKRASASRK